MIVANRARLKFADIRVHYRQWIAAMTLANVKVNRELGFLREQPGECRVSGLAFTFATHEVAPAL